MKRRKKILVFTATYNEINNVEKLLLKIRKTRLNLDILILDDNSPDGTGKKLKKLEKKLKNLFFLSRKSKQGLDSAHKIAYRFARKKNYDYLITMDADLSHDPKEIRNFIYYLEQYPFVIGSRYMKGGKCLMKGTRLLLSKSGNMLIRNILRINLTEFTTSYRGFNLKMLKNFSLNRVKNKGYSFFMGTVYEIYKLKFAIKEIPIIFKDREKGYSKIPKLEIFRTLKNVILLSFK
tara:strand:+ start:1006 stop:1710 length:705 start_codon:yes stop_codon:yes gene_type:complete